MKLTIAKPTSAFTRLLPRVSVLDRYLLQELIGPFLFGVGLFSSVGVTVGTVFELVRKVTESGLPIDIAIRYFLLKMPDFIVLAFPMSMILATLMAYSRLSSDSELIALRSCGIGIYRLVVPAILLSFFVTGLTFTFNEIIVPNANYQASQILNEALNREQLPFREQNIFYPEYRDVEQLDGSKDKILVRLFYAEQFDGEKMKGLTILDRSQAGLKQIVSAESAVWNPQNDEWDFYQGTAYVVSSDGSFRNIVRFDHKQLKLPRTPLDLAGKGRDYGEMNIAQAEEYLQTIKLSGDDQKIRKLKVRIQQKYALPFVCVVFGLIGAALGTKPKNRSGGKATSFGISVVVIFTYYLFAHILSGMGINGIVTPYMSAWLPTFVGLGVGMLFLMRASR